MPEIEITEDQYEYLDGLRQDIQTEVAGRYATVRFVDALQYLIDSHEGDTDAGFSPPGADASDGPAATGAGGAGASGDDTAPSAGGDESSDDADPAAGGTEPSADGGASAAPGGSDAGAPQMAAAGGGDDDGILSAMMQLLETHDDRWHEVEGDTGYEVELPDGSTEAANTRDDVRALLYKHYE